MMGLSLLFIAFLQLFTPSTNELAQTYVDSYKSISIDEMNRTGIPASIKLAQGLLESDWGRSDLANKANNHFGIKCGNAWDGPEFYKEDDDFHTDGKLMPSCFRKFDSAIESYIAHSDFLLDPRKESRYGFLFQLDIKDYKAWANGLRQAGYATDPSYPDKLISIIEKYKLYQYDEDYKSSPIADSSISRLKKDNFTKSTSVIKNNSGREIRQKYTIAAINDARYITTIEEISLDEVAAAVGISSVDLISFNEHLTFGYDLISSGSRIYIEKKNKDYHGKEEYHIVKNGETLQEISQLYGLREASLRSLNKVANNAEPFDGEKVSLKKKVSGKNRPKTRRVLNANKTPKILFE